MPPTTLAPGEGEIVTDEPDHYVEIHVDRPELALTYSRYSAGKSGPESHVHREHTDSFHVLSGELVFEVGPGGERVTAGPGTFVSVPPGVVHTFRNEGPGEARFLNAHTPSKGFADHLRGGSKPGSGFDSFDPPEDGGRPASEAICWPGAG